VEFGVLDQGMQQSLTVEVTFLCPGQTCEDVDTVPAEGFIRRADGIERRFDGWIDLLAALEGVAVEAATVAEVPR
jgi:hypothetical protein